MNNVNVIKMTSERDPGQVTAGADSKRWQAMELNLLGSTSFAELGKLLQGDYRRLLSADVMSLFVFDRNNQSFELANEDEQQSESYTFQLLSRGRDERYITFCKAGILAGAYSEEQHARLFPHHKSLINSVLVLPLSRRAKIVGLLAVGSASLLPEMLSNEQLKRFASIVAVCVENLYSQEMIRQVSLHDPLTGLFNRRYFSDHVDRALSRAQRDGGFLCCIYLDVDHFKKINDVHGHAAGDVVLRTLCERIQVKMRGGEVLARMGGEEFCVLLEEANETTGKLVAERLRTTVAGERILLPKGDEVPVTISCGVASSRLIEGVGRAEAVDDLLDRADSALYLAKQNGRNCVMVDS